MTAGAMVGMGLAFAAVGVGGVQGALAPLWRGVSQIVLVCGEELDPVLCDAAYASARTRTALPIKRAVYPSTPNGADRNTVLLTLTTEHGVDGRQLAAVARRAVEIDEAEAPARAAVRWPTAEPVAAINGLLARILPRRMEGDRWSG